MPLLVLVGWRGIGQRLSKLTSLDHSNQDDVTLVRKFQDPIQDLSRAWNSRIGKESFRWCHTNQHAGNPPGLIYIKVDKAASSTLAGINIRLAHKVGAMVLPRHSSSTWWHMSKTVAEPQVCSHTYSHGRASQVLHQTNHNTNRPSSSPVLLWTFLRDPLTRAVSEFNHFWISRKGYGARNGIVQPFLESRKNFQLKYIMDHAHPEQALARVTNNESANPDNRQNATNVKSSPVWQLIEDRIMNVYDFIGVVERLEESLAVMKLLWGVDLQDLIVLSAKKSGGWDDGRYNNTCYQITPPSSTSVSSSQSHRGDVESLSPYLLNYIHTDFLVGNYDYGLYAIVNASLDRTIAILGQARVDRTRQELRLLQALVESKCQDDAIFPCSSNGTLQHERSAKNCYWFDSGCGFACVDRVLDERNI